MTLEISKKGGKLYRILRIILLGSVFCFLAFAQEYKGSVLVTVTAEDGQPLPGATVTLTSSTFNRTFVADAAGKARFIGLEPDTYEIKVVLAGMTTFIRPGVVLDVGANLKMDAVMAPEAASEAMVVTADVPIMDTTRVGTATIVTPDELSVLPQPRDPWSVMATVPSVQTDRINVGGNEAGQQSNFTTKGDDGDTSSWVMDGVEFTDPGARGASQSYLDFSSFSQIGVTTGGADASQRAGGARLNFVTKRGSNAHTGSMRLLFADQDFQAENNSGIFRLNGTPFLGNRIEETFEKSFELGGPIIKDRLWYWVAFSQNTIDITVIDGSSDKTTLENKSVKFHGDITPTTRFNVFYTEGDKIKAGRGAGADRPRNTTWNQSGPTPIYKFEISQLIGDHTELTATYGRVDGKFSLTPIGDQSGQISLDLDSGIWADTTFFNYGTVRPTRQYDVKGNTFLSTGNMDHELKYGFTYFDAAVASSSVAGDDQVLSYHYSGVSDSVLLYREGNMNTDLERKSIYVSDTATIGNWTIVGGLRWDDQSGQNTPTSTRGNRFDPEALPDLDFEGQATPFKWNTIAPRIGATYSWGKENEHLARANFAIYYDDLTSGFITDTNPAWYVYTYNVWNDLDGDLIVDEGEVGERLGGDADPDNPAAQTTIHEIDPNLDPPQTTEFILGYEYAITPQFTVGAALTYKNLDDEEWRGYKGGLTSGHWRLADDTIDGVNPYTGESFSLPYYILTMEGAALNPNRGSYLTNRPDYAEEYTGLEFTVTKRLADKWMLRGNFVFQDWVRDVGAGAIQCPNILQDGRNTDGAVIGIQSGGSGNKANVWLGSSKWTANINGLYQLPWDLTIAANLAARDGYAAPLGYRIAIIDEDGFYTRSSTTGVEEYNNTVLAVGAFDDHRYEDVYNLDLKLTKAFTMGSTRVEIACEAFNVFNENTILQENLRLDQTTTASEPREILSPRILRFSSTINF